jgi:hypothetical protein
MLLSGENGVGKAALAGRWMCPLAFSRAGRLLIKKEPAFLGDGHTATETPGEDPILIDTQLGREPPETTSVSFAFIALRRRQINFAASRVPRLLVDCNIRTKVFHAE